MKNRHRYTKEQINWLEKNCLRKTAKELTDKFNECFKTNLTIRQIEAFKNRRNLKSGFKRRYSQEQIEWLKQNVISSISKQQVDEFNEKFNTFYTLKNLCQKCHRLGIINREKYKIGEERLYKDGYIYVKVSKNKWIQKQRHIYKQHHGKIPKGYKVIFLDGDKYNFKIDNLYLVSLDIACILETQRLRGNDKEITKTGILLAELISEKAKIKKERVKKNDANMDVR